MLYDKEAIEKQLHIKNKSPITNLSMGDNLLKVKHVTNVIESLLSSGVKDDRLIAWEKAKKDKKEQRERFKAGCPTRGNVFRQHLHSLFNSKTCVHCLKVSKLPKLIKLINQAARRS